MAWDGVRIGMVPGFLVILLMGALLLRVHKQYAKNIVGSSTSYWELVDAFRNRSWDDVRKSKRLRAADQSRRSLELFLLVLGVTLVVLGIVGFLGLIPQTRNP